MADHYVEIACPREDCEATIHFDLDYEQADPNYGADADGNRGMYIPGYWFLASEPKQCSDGHLLTDEELIGVTIGAASAADNYHEDNEL